MFWVSNDNNRLKIAYLRSCWLQEPRKCWRTTLVFWTRDPAALTRTTLFKDASLAVSTLFLPNVDLFSKIKTKQNKKHKTTITQQKLHTHNHNYAASHCWSRESVRVIIYGTHVKKDLESIWVWLTHGTNQLLKFSQEYRAKVIAVIREGGRQADRGKVCANKYDNLMTGS